jgi:hypothetical protein
MSSDAPSAIFFPLRSSVELFDDPRSPAAVVRAKEAACLYDRVIFEPGLLDVTIASNGSMPWWYPKEHLTPELRREARRPIPLGSPVSFAIGKQSEQGVPAPPEAMRGFPLGGLSVRYVAEFYTGILDDLAEFNVDWVDVQGGGEIDRSHPVGAEVAREIEALDREDRWDKTLMPEQENEWVRRYVSQSFNRDAVIAGELGAAFNITPMFVPMVERRGVRPDLPGSEALSYLIPNLGRLPWEAIVEFREHDGSREARAKLREFDRRAAEDAQDAYDYGRRAGHELTAALFGALEDQRPSLPEELAKEALLGAVDLVPGVGPIAGKTASVAQTIREDRRLRRHWTSALMLLRERR